MDKMARARPGKAGDKAASAKRRPSDGAKRKADPKKTSQKRPDGPIEAFDLTWALKASQAALFEVDADDGALVWADEATARDVLGLDRSPLPTTLAEWTARIARDDLAARTAAADSRDFASPCKSEYRLQAPQAPVRWIEESGLWIAADETRGERYVAVLRDVTEVKRREEQLIYAGSYDELTGNLNRGKLRELLDAEIASSRTTETPSAYLVAGIDDLGAINADFGFDVADEVIVQIARRMNATLGTADAMGRSAGNKFGIILRNCPDENIRERCRELISAVRSAVIDTSKGGVAASVCIGAVGLPKDASSSEIAIARAEAALDEARRIGRASWTVFTEKTDIVTSRRRNTYLSDEILSALNERRICLAYQPIVADIGETPSHYECLIRLRQDDGTVVGAGELIGAAEKLGLVHLLDRRVLELATQTLGRHPSIKLNLNVSWETVKDPVWMEGYLAHLRANRKVVNRLTVELTETRAVDTIELSVEFVDAVKNAGCQFAIDDFGAGYTSFRNLKALDIDMLKIDGSFVTGVSKSRENQLFVRTLLDLARNFGLHTVAEWVENASDAEVLKALGVDFLQGYYVGEPAFEMDTPLGEDAPAPDVKLAPRKAARGS